VDSVRTLTPPAPRPQTPHPSTASLDSKVIKELASRRQSIFARARAILREDHYQRLSLARDASMAQVDQAFTALRTLWDPTLLPPALEEAKADCAFIMTCLQEAYATLRNPAARAEYAQRLTLDALRAPPDPIEDDLAAAGSADPLEAAQICFTRGDAERAERLARRAARAAPDQGPPLALLAWIEATRPQNQGVEETRKRIAVLDKALRIDETMTEAFYWRAQLHKRIENHSAAMRDFRKVIDLQPNHIEAVRELRLYEMRIRRNSISMKAVK
jgi:tetratricopeptide (TPR) repeat protein